MKRSERDVILFVLSLIYAATSFAVQEPPEAKLVELERLIGEHEAFLRRYPENEFTAVTTFQLAELYYERAQLIFQQKTAEPDIRPPAEREGNDPLQPDFTPTISLCRGLLERYPQLTFRDQVMYRLATAYQEAGKEDEAAFWFGRLALEENRSPYAAEALFRLGEYDFDRRRFEEAAAHYAKLLELGAASFARPALYKLGWTYFNLRRWEDASQVFLTLLERTAASNAEEAADLTAEAIHYLADSFIEGGGTAAAEAALKSRLDRPYTPQLLEKAAQLYEKRSLPQQAVDVYRLLVRFYPDSPAAPDYYLRMIEDWEAAGDMAEANRVREEAIEQFAPGGPWAMRLQNPQAAEKGAQLAREAVIFLGKYHQAKGKETHSAEEFRRAAREYERFLALFPTDPLCGEIWYYLAESLFAVEEYEAAAEAYRSAASADSPWREKAAFNRVLSRLKLRCAAAPDTLRLVGFLNTEAVVVLPNVPRTDGELLLACNDFCGMFPQSGLLDQVLMTFGQVLYENGALFSAVKAYERVLHLSPASPLRAAAAGNIAQVFFDSRRYEEAYTWYVAAAKLTTDFEEARQFQRAAISAQFKLAEQLSGEGRSVEAARVLQRVSMIGVDPRLEARALFDAALQMQQADSLLQAARLFEQLVLRFPDSELADRALFQAGSLREQLADWAPAAADYLQAAEDYPASPLRRQAVRNAVRCYEAAEEWLAVKTAARRFVELYADSTESLEFLYKSGEAAQRLNQPLEANWAFRQVIERFNALQMRGRDVDPYFAAAAQFMLAEERYAGFREITLRPPFETNLKKKMAAFNAVLQAYGDAARYRSADWTPAAMFRIGETLEEMARALVEAPLPDGLTLEEQLLYRQKLAESSLPFMQRALEAHQSNIAQAAANGIDNRWVAMSREHVLRLQSELSQTAGPIPAASEVR